MRAAVRGPAVSNAYPHTNPDSYADALDTPPIACGTSASSNIGVDVTAGDSGAPNGFVVEWLTFAVSDGGDGCAGYGARSTDRRAQNW